MQLRKLSVVLLALLLAAMAMVPMVSANEAANAINSDKVSTNQTVQIPDAAQKAEVENWINNHAGEEIPADEWLKIMAPEYYEKMTAKQKAGYHEIKTTIPDLNQDARISEKTEKTIAFGTRSGASKEIVPIPGAYGGSTAATWGLISTLGWSRTWEPFPEQNVQLDLYFRPTGSSNWQYDSSVTSQAVYATYCQANGYKYLPSTGTYKSVVAAYGTCPPDSINPYYYESKWTNEVEYT